MDLSNEQWKKVEPIIKQNRKDLKSGRPRVDDRAVLNGILWVLRTGSTWRELPECYPSYQTCHRRFLEWKNNGIFEEIIWALVEDLNNRGGMDLANNFESDIYVVADITVDGLRRPNGIEIRNSWQWQIALIFLEPYPQEILRRMKSYAKRWDT